MSKRMRLTGLGAHLEVRCTGARADLLWTAMTEAWSRCLVCDDVDGPVAPPVEVRLDDEADLPHRLMRSTQEITRALITAQIGNLLMLHAGAVSHPMTGDSLVYVAPGGTGKTTLSRLLGKRFGYITDETVGVTEEGRILPYPKPLSTERAGTGLKDEVSPDVLSLLPASEVAHVTRIVILDRGTKAETLEVEELGFMDALTALVEQTSSLAALDRPLHRMEALIDGAGPVLRIRYHESADIGEDLSTLIEATP